MCLHNIWRSIRHSVSNAIWLSCFSVQSRPFLISFCFILKHDSPLCMRHPSIWVGECLEYSWWPVCQPVRLDCLVRWIPIRSFSGVEDFVPFQIRLVTAIDYLVPFDNVRYKVQIHSETEIPYFSRYKFKKIYVDRIGIGYCPFARSSRLIWMLEWMIRKMVLH